MATLSNPSDSLNKLFDTEKKASIESTPLQQWKIGHEKSDTVGSSLLTQHRRSTRNPRIGSGFNNKSDNPVEVIDKKADEDDDNNDDEEGIPTGIPIRNAIVLPHEDQVTINSICTTDTLARLRKEYQILDVVTLTLPHRGYDVYTPVKGEVLIHVATFECGLRLPLHPTLRKILVTLGLAPLQISPGFYKHLLGFLVLWKEQCEIDGTMREPGYDEVWYIFQVAAFKTCPKGQFYLRAKNPLKFIVLGATMKYPRSWLPIQFSGQEKWGKGKISKKSGGILEKILGQFYVNVKYPVSDSFDGSRIDRYLKISLAVPYSFSSASDSPTANVGVSLGPSRPTTTPPLTPTKSQPSPPTTFLVPLATLSPFSEMATRVAKVRDLRSQTQRQTSTALSVTLSESSPVIPPPPLPTFARLRPQCLRTSWSLRELSLLLRYNLLPLFLPYTVGAELENSKREQARYEKSINFLSRSLTDAEKARDKALADSARLEQASNMETLKSLHRREERGSLKSEKVLLRDENQLLQGSIKNLEAKTDDAFGDSYFYASYEVAKAFPPPFDLKTSIG
ncbi:hypothetical protein QYF36_014143 [Acer negundo]|nr:hypothetical protein QYF36_014143 [Acer negundo]